MMNRKALYIRFGDLPTGEKSAIWKDGRCIGYESGVSVYEAHINERGIYVPLLPFPLTSTTLNDYVFYLTYFRGRKYLVQGDLLGNCGTSGEPLIVNVEIITELVE